MNRLPFEIFDYIMFLTKDPILISKYCSCYFIKKYNKILLNEGIDNKSFCHSGIFGGFFNNVLLSNNKSECYKFLSNPPNIDVIYTFKFRNQICLCDKIHLEQVVVDPYLVQLYSDTFSLPFMLYLNQFSVLMEISGFCFDNAVPVKLSEEFTIDDSDDEGLLNYVSYAINTMYHKRLYKAPMCVYSGDKLING